MGQGPVRTLEGPLAEGRWWSKQVMTVPSLSDRDAEGENTTLWGGGQGGVLDVVTSKLPLLQHACTQRLTLKGRQEQAGGGDSEGV